MRIITGAYKGHRLRTVSGPGYRPAMSRVREAIFSILDARGMSWQGARVLDLFAGSGSLGFEALSRGAALALFVESDKTAADCLAQNALNLKCLDKVLIVRKDVLKYLRGYGEEQFQMIFIDPPYGNDLFLSSLNAVLDQNMLRSEGFLLAEVHKKQAFPKNFGWDQGLTLEINRCYGQTRILLWQQTA